MWTKVCAGFDCKHDLGILKGLKITAFSGLSSFSCDIEFNVTPLYYVDLCVKKIIFYILQWYIPFYPKFDLESDLQKDHDLKMSHSKSIILSVATMMS